MQPMQLPDLMYIDKTAIMGPMGERCTNLGGDDVSYTGERIDEVDSYVFLGVIFDVLLTFFPHLRGLVAKGWASFNDLLGATFCHNLLVPLQAACVPGQVESTCLYSMELCVLTKGVEHDINKMQAV